MARLYLLAGNPHSSGELRFPVIACSRDLHVGECLQVRKIKEPRKRTRNELSSSSSGSPDPERDGSGSEVGDGAKQHDGGEGDNAMVLDGGAEGDSAKKQVGKKQRRVWFSSIYG